MDIFARIRSFVHELVGVPVDDIKPESTPAELNMDRFDVTDLVLELEDEYDVIINDGSCNTLNDIVEQVKAA